MTKDKHVALPFLGIEGSARIVAPAEFVKAGGHPCPAGRVPREKILSYSMADVRPGEHGLLQIVRSRPLALASCTRSHVRVCACTRARVGSLHSLRFAGPHPSGSQERACRLQPYLDHMIPRRPAAVAAETDDDKQDGEREPQDADRHRPPVALLAVADDGLFRHRRRIAADARHAHTFRVEKDRLFAGLERTGHGLQGNGNGLPAS